MTKVLMSTTMGDIEIELNLEKAPKTCANFIKYTEKDFYKDTIFHRVIKKFMIQGGGFTIPMTQKDTSSSIQNEANNGLKNSKGTIAMARTMDPHSASSQFFINLKDNNFLNFKAKDMQGWGYAVFGKVTKGIDVVEKIGTVKTKTHQGMADVPIEPVIIKTIKILKDK